jgi:hypothetical protein
VNRDNINPLVMDMADKLMQVRLGLPLSSAISSINYKMCNIASQLHLKVDTMSGYKPAPCNAYQLTLLNSGGGKNSSISLLDRFYFGDAFNKIKDNIFPLFKDKALKMLEESGIDRSLHSWTQSISNATVSGMYAYAETYSLCKFGSMNIEVDEIGNAIISKAELFEQLLTPYDEGNFQPVAKRSDSNSIDIEGVPVNLYCFGNKVRLFNGDNTEREFIKILDEGYGRRFIFTDDVSSPKDKTAEEVLSEMKLSEQIRKNSTEKREYIASLVTAKNMNRVIALDDSAMLFYARIKADGDRYVNNTRGLPPAVIADISERHFKTIKLAGVYALFDGGEYVTERNMIEAFEVIKESSSVLSELRRIKPLHERLLTHLMDEAKPVTSQHMLSYPFINATWTKKVLEIIDLAKQLASERGYEWIEDIKRGVTYYTVKYEYKDEELF